MTAINIDELEQMARECRALASAATHEIVREEILDLAAHFEQRARHQRQVSPRRSLA